MNNVDVKGLNTIEMLSNYNIAGYTTNRCHYREPLALSREKKLAKFEHFDKHGMDLRTERPSAI